MIKLIKGPCSLLCLICLLLVACAPIEKIVAENDIYRILMKDGQYYLEMKEADAADGENLFETPPSVVFKSLSEMKNDILTGQFTEEEWSKIKRFRSGQIMNLDALLAPNYPDNLDGYTIKWIGGTYSFLLTDAESEMECQFFELTKEAVDSLINSRHELHQRACERVETDPETNGKVYTIPPVLLNGRGLKYRVYTKEIAGRMFFVEEQYWADVDCLEVFQEAPSCLRIYASDSEDHYYGLLVDYLTEFPSDEWLAAFGFVPYVE